MDGFIDCARTEGERRPSSMWYAIVAETFEGAVCLLLIGFLRYTN